MLLILLTPTQTHSDDFLTENNCEEWFWKCHRRQWHKWSQDHDKPDNIKSRLVKWGICTEAEFDLRMTLSAEWRRKEEEERAAKFDRDDREDSTNEEVGAASTNTLGEI